MCECIDEDLGVCVSVRRTGGEGETRWASWGRYNQPHETNEETKAQKRYNTVRAGWQAESSPIHQNV